MRLLKQAALPSLAALMLVLGAGPLKADRDAWTGFDRGIDSSGSEFNTRQNWTPRQQARPARPTQARPGSSSDSVLNWFQPLPDLPRSQNIEPEAPPARAEVVFTYRADPMVELGDPALVRPAALSERRSWRSGRQVSQAIFEALKSASSGVQVTKQQRDDIVAFYRERDFAPLWVSPGAVDARADDLRAALADAAAHGLEPEDYLAMLPDDGAAPAGDHRQLARLDLALTAAALRYAMHASGGRLIPNRLSAYHDLKPPTVDGREALNRLASDPSPSAYLTSLNPVHPAYEALREALGDLRARGGGGDAVPIADGAIVKPGQTDARMPAIRDRLVQLGHLTPAAAVAQQQDVVPISIDSQVPVFGSAETVVIVEAVIPAPRGTEPGRVEPRSGETFEAETVEALKAFQAASGIKVDGIIGPQTISALNSNTTAERIRRLVYSLERLRWMPRDFGAKHIFVNAAGFGTEVIENGRTIWQSKVIVGKPQHQTVFFSDEMDHVVFNPYWGVPASIIVRDMLPEVRNDPSWFDREGFEVLDRQGRVIPSQSVDWWNIDSSNLPIGVRQPPGPKNALGEIKFMFPNKHAIYLHDTPSKPLFNRSTRAFSNGCVRVEDPWGFTKILLGWDEQRIAETRASTYNHTVRLDSKIPVHLAYFTAWPDATGTVRYFEDVYGRDKLLDRAFGKVTLAMR